MLYRAAITTLSNGASVQLAQSLVHLNRVAERAQTIPIKQDNCIKPEVMALANLIRLWDLTLPESIWSKMRKKLLATEGAQDNYNSVVEVVEMIARLILRIRVVHQIVYNRSLLFYTDHAGDLLPLAKMSGFVGLSTTAMVLRICEDKLKAKGTLLVQDLQSVKQLATPANRAQVNVLSESVNRTLCI